MLLTKRNCGIGSNGFEPGNDCAKGDGSGSSDKAASGSGGSASQSSETQVEQSTTYAVDLLYQISDKAEESGVTTEWNDVLDLQPDLSDTDAIAFYKDEGYQILTGAAEKSDEATVFDLNQVDRAGKKYGTITSAEIKRQVEAAAPSERKALQAKLQEQQQEARQTAIEGMRVELETQTATAKLGGPVQMYRGMALSDEEIERIISEGRVTHTGVNSWTTHPMIANKFARQKVVLVTNKATRGIVQRQRNKDAGLEFEIVRPPSSMKVEKVVRSKDGTTFIYVDEDEIYKD